MTTKKYTTNINKANNNNTLKVTIPSQIVDLLELSSDDTLKWIAHSDGTVCIEKLEL